MRHGETISGKRNRSVGTRRSDQKLYTLFSREIMAGPLQKRAVSLSRLPDHHPERHFHVRSITEIAGLKERIPAFLEAGNEGIAIISPSIIHNNFIQQSFYTYTPICIIDL
jgi:hypothetical protein